MDFRKKLKIRLYTAITYIVLGVIMIATGIITKSENTFISSFGFALMIIGIANIKKYFLITRSEESLRKREIAESDERNIAISSKAKSVTFSLYIILSCSAVIILSLLNMQKIALPISYSVCLLIIIYRTVYVIIRKKS